MTISYGYYNAFRLRQLTGIPITQLCEVACEIAYNSLLKDAGLLERTREEYGVRTPWKQLEIDMKKGYKRVIPLECFGELEESQSGLTFQEIFPTEEGVLTRDE